MTCFRAPLPSQLSTLTPDLISKAIDIDPEPGMVILFPSGMYHSVVPSTSQEKRYSVAFNTVPVGQVGKPTSYIDL